MPAVDSAAFDQGQDGAGILTGAFRDPPRPSRDCVAAGGGRLDGRLRCAANLPGSALLDVFRSTSMRRPARVLHFLHHHVAGVMHRYWCDVFPEDFPERKVPAGNRRSR